jgi:hypothetical protein
MFDYKPFTYWDSLRKNNPAKYYSLKSLKQMQVDCSQLGLSAFLKATEDHSNDLRW